MAFCPNCGTPNTDQAEKCVACGFELIVPKQKAKFKGTIMMSGIKAPTHGEPRAEAVGDQPTEPPPKPEPSLPPLTPAAKSGIESGRNPNYAKTMLGHAPVVAPPGARGPENTPLGVPSRSAPVAPAAPSVSAEVPSFGRANALSSSTPHVVAADASASGPSTPETSGSGSWTGVGAPRRAGGYDSTVPPSARPSGPKPGKIIALGCGVALLLFCVVGAIGYYVVGAKIRSMMSSDDSAAEAAAWQASIVQSLAQVTELCKTDCSQAGVYFHPQREAALLSEARALNPARLQKLSDSTHTEASMLNGTDDEAAATKLGLDPQQCARVRTGSAKVISCSVPDPTGKPSVLRIVELSGVMSL